MLPDIQNHPEVKKMSQYLTRKEAANYKVAAGIKAILHGVNSLEVEVSNDLAQRFGLPIGGPTLLPPWQALTRDLGAAAGAGAIGEVTTDAVAALRARTLVARYGGQVLPDQKSNIASPVVSDSVTSEFLPDDLSPLTPSDPVIGQVTGTPKIMGSLNVHSHQLMKQADAPGVLERDMLNVLGAGIDAGVLNGSGTNGEPEGLTVNADVQVQSGTALAWSGITSMEQTVEDANGVPSGYIADPATKKLLRERVKFSGTNSPIWANGMIDDTLAGATSSCPAASLFVGPWDTIVIPIFGPGPQIDVDPSTYFSSGRFQLRVLLRFDVMLRQASAFVRATSIT